MSCGHLICGLLLGMKPEKMELMPYGVAISFKLTAKDYNRKIKKANQLEIKKIAVALAGPLTNILIILIVWQLNMNVFDGLMMLYANLLLILFNLLPIHPLDGGRILKGILHIYLGKIKAEKYTNTISFICLMTITLICSILIYLVQNIAIFFIILVLWGLFIKEDIKYKKRNEIYHLLEKTEVNLEKSLEIKSN